MGTPITMAREAEKVEPVQQVGAIQASGGGAVIASGTHEAITALRPGG